MAGIEIAGVSGFEAGIDALIAAVQESTRLAVMSGAHLIEAQAKQSMNGPGPQVRTGTLRRSINVIDTTTLGAGSYQARIAPTVIYGRTHGTRGIPSRQRLAWRNATTGRSVSPYLATPDSTSSIPQCFKACSPPHGKRRCERNHFPALQSTSSATWLTSRSR